MREITSVNIGHVIDGRFGVRGLVRGADAIQVVEVEHLESGQRLTVKIVKPSADVSYVECLKREARQLIEVDHPNALSVLEVGRCGRFGDFIVTEAQRGEPLSAMLRERGSLTVEMASRVGVAVASALSGAHEAGLVHSDLHPGNVLVEVADGEAMGCKVMGFGVDRGGVYEGARPCDAGLVYDPERYMAPERGFGAESSPEGDQFSLGMLMYRMLAGRLPEQAAIDNDTPRPLSEYQVGIPRELERAVMRAIQRAPGRRFESVEAMLDAIARSAVCAGDEKVDGAEQAISTMVVVDTGESEDGVEEEGGAVEALRLEWEPKRDVRSSATLEEYSA